MLHGTLLAYIDNQWQEAGVIICTMHSKASNSHALEPQADILQAVSKQAQKQVVCVCLMQEAISGILPDASAVQRADDAAASLLAEEQAAADQAAAKQAKKHKQQLEKQLARQLGQQQQHQQVEQQQQQQCQSAPDSLHSEASQATQESVTDLETSLPSPSQLDDAAHLTGNGQSEPQLHACYPEQDPSQLEACSWAGGQPDSPAEQKLLNMHVHQQQSCTHVLTPPTPLPAQPDEAVCTARPQPCFRQPAERSRPNATKALITTPSATHQLSSVPQPALTASLPACSGQCGSRLQHDGMQMHTRLWSNTREGFQLLQSALLCPLTQVCCSHPYRCRLP